jgi:hypothetical protein
MTTPELHARAHETVRIRSRRPRRRCNNNRHCVYAVEDNQDGPPSNNDQGARAQHATDADPPDNPVHDATTTDENRAPPEPDTRTEAQTGTRALGQPTVVETPDPTLQRRLDQLARTPRQSRTPRQPVQPEAEPQGRQITDALVTLLERSRYAELNIQHILDALRNTNEAVRTTNRNVEDVQDRASDDRKLARDLGKQVRKLGEQLEDLTRIAERTRAELSNLIDYVGAGPDRMEHDLSFDMSAIVGVNG